VGPIHGPVSPIVYGLGFWFIRCPLSPQFGGPLPPSLRRPLPPLPKGPISPPPGSSLPPPPKGPPPPLLISIVYPQVDNLPTSTIKDGLNPFGHGTIFL
jgi:hypothetical protein